MSSLIATKVKQICVLVSVKISIIRTILLTNYTIIIPIMTTIISLFFSACNLCASTFTLFLSHYYSLFCSQLICKCENVLLKFSQQCSLNTQLILSQGWLIYFWLLSAPSCSFIVLQGQAIERSWNRRFLFSHSRLFHYDHLYMCIPICLSLMLIFASLGDGCIY